MHILDTHKVPFGVDGVMHQLQQFMMQRANTAVQVGEVVVD